MRATWHPLRLTCRDGADTSRHLSDFGVECWPVGLAGLEPVAVLLILGDNRGQRTALSRPVPLVVLIRVMQALLPVGVDIGWLAYRRMHDLGARHAHPCRLRMVFSLMCPHVAGSDFIRGLTDRGC